MRYQFYREHKYVSAALNDVERLIARADFRDESALDQVKSEFQALTGMLKGHAEYENHRLHVLLKKKGLLICEHAEEDHAEQDKQLEKIGDMIRAISQECDPDKRIEKGYHLYLTYRKFVADNLAHLHEEETQILPELQKHYSDQELQQVEAQSYREMTPEQMNEMMGVLFPHMNLHDQKAILRDIESLEPEKFKVVLSRQSHPG